MTYTTSLNAEIIRLQDLRSYNIIDSLPEEELDEIVEIASLICDTPIALITMIEEDRQWFKAKKGLAICETSREDSFCKYTLTRPKEIMVVNDSLLDERFINNPFVIGDPSVRFYAGVPLETPDGNILGTLCVIDHEPKEITENQKKSLKLLAKRTMDHLNMRKMVNDQKKTIKTSAANLKVLTDNVPGGIFQLRMNTTGDLKFDFLSAGIKKLHPSIDLAEWQKDPKVGYSVIHPEDLPGFLKSLETSYKTLEIWQHEYRAKSRNGYKWHMVKAKPERAFDGSVVWSGSFQDIHAHIEYQDAMEQISFDISHVLRRPVTNLVGLINMMEDEKSINQIVWNEYSDYIQTVATELEKFTRDLNDVYEKKKEIISGNTSR